MSEPNDIAKDAAEQWYNCIHPPEPLILRLTQVIQDAITRATAADKERIAQMEREHEEVTHKRILETIQLGEERNSLRAQLAEKTQECEGLRNKVRFNPDAPHVFTSHDNICNICGKVESNLIHLPKHP